MRTLEQVLKDTLKEPVGLRDEVVDPQKLAKLLLEILEKLEQK